MGVMIETQKKINQPENEMETGILSSHLGLGGLADPTP